LQVKTILNVSVKNHKNFVSIIETRQGLIEKINNLKDISDDQEKNQGKFNKDDKVGFQSLFSIYKYTMRVCFLRKKLKNYIKICWKC
jgi:hypothetical protein